MPPSALRHSQSSDLWLQVAYFVIWGQNESKCSRRGLLPRPQPAPFVCRSEADQYTPGYAIRNFILADGCEQTNNLFVVVWGIIGDEHHCFSGILMFQHRDEFIFHPQHKHVAIHVVMVVANMRLGDPQRFTR
jgi:hypothetical protein